MIIYLIIFIYFSALISEYDKDIESNFVSVIDTNTNEVVGNPIEVGLSPFGIAYDPIHKRMYVVNAGDDTVLIIDTNTNRVVDSLVLIGVIPSNIVYDPKHRMYVTLFGR